MRASYTAMLIVCALAALVPFLDAKEPTASTDAFSGFPTQFEGQPLRALPLGEIEKRFAAEFPGRIGRFTDGHREIVIRFISQESRKLHPASDCFRGVGYSISPQPIVLEANDTRWGTFIATRGSQRLHVRERIYDAAGEQWTDVSAWYWAAARGSSTGPWWAITVASSQSDGG